MGVCKIWQQYFTPPKSPIVRGVKYDCHIMHPLKDQREGVKYGRGVKYGVTPARPQVGKLVVACRWLAVYSTEP